MSFWELKVTRGDLSNVQSIMEFLEKIIQKLESIKNAKKINKHTIKST